MKSLFITIILLFFISFGWAQEWDKVIGSPQNCCLTSNSLQKLESGNLFFSGSQFYNDSNFAYLLKLNPNGDSLWSSKIPDVYPENLNKISSNRFILSGFKQDLKTSEANSYLAIIDTFGNVIKEKEINIPNKNCQIEFSEYTSDKGFISCGFITQEDNEANDFFVLKLDSNLNIEWYKNFGFSKNEACHMVHETPEGDFVVSGDSQDENTGLYNIYCLKLDKNGNKIWETLLGDDYNNGNQSFIITSDGDYLLVGEGTTMESFNFDIVIMKITKDGTLKWFQNVGSNGSEAGFFVTENDNKEYLITGYSTTDTNRPNTIFLTKINQNGLCVGTKFFPKQNVSLGYDLISTGSNYYAIAGRTGTAIYAINTLDGNYTDTFKTQEVKTGIKYFNSNIQSITIFPNPSSDFLYVDKNSVPLQHIEIVNLIGIPILKINEIEIQKIDIRSIPNGIYVLKGINLKGISVYTKFIKV